MCIVVNGLFRGRRGNVCGPCKHHQLRNTVGSDKCQLDFSRIVPCIAHEGVRTMRSVAGAVERLNDLIFTKLPVYVPGGETTARMRQAREVKKRTALIEVIYVIMFW